ncbi:hypothetical protein [Belliella pelovolcani]|uniref:hypothetical protein n=1 Tax=Belliella pelovolcani TaxID=529505 RepID=UPI0039197EE0
MKDNLRNSGRSGSAKFSNENWAREPIYSMNDLAYLWSRKDRVEKYALFLSKLKLWQESESHYITLKTFLEKNQINFRITKALKNLGCSDENNYLRKDIDVDVPLAIKVVLEIRELERKLKLK